MKTDTVLFDTITPCPDPVHIGHLLTNIEAVIKRHVILGDHAAAALAVWVLHTYTFELRDTVAYVAIESPEKRCGKTTLLSVLAAMACKPLIASNVTLSALFRAIDTCSPTLFIDEADTFLAGNGAMRGIINSGNTRRAAYVLRLSASKRTRQAKDVGLSKQRSHSLASPSPHCPSPAGAGEGGRRPGEGTRGNTEYCGEGESNENTLHVHDPNTNTHSGLTRYSCWCPKVIAMIGQVPDTIADRSIIVQMSRKLVSETCVPLAELNTTEIRAKCARFALDASTFITQCPKHRASGLNDRAADTFDPLFVIARLAGEEWEKKLHTAALALASTSDSNNSGAGLIMDILDIIFNTGHDKIFTRDLVAIMRDGGMKSQTLKYSSINEHQIARILRPYGIKPVCVRIGAHVRNGYVGDDFREALSRYVSRDDIEARMEAIQRRMQLQIEADAEGQKIKALADKVIARSPRTLGEAKAMFQEELESTPKASAPGM